MNCFRRKTVAITRGDYKGSLVYNGSHIAMPSITYASFIGVVVCLDVFRLFPRVGLLLVDHLVLCTLALHICFLNTKPVLVALH